MTFACLLVYRVNQNSIKVVGDTGATHADLMEAVQSFVCVLIGIHSQSLKTIIHK